jgi:hypothetical protein
VAASILVAPNWGSMSVIRIIDNRLGSRVPARSWSIGNQALRQVTDFDVEDLQRMPIDESLVKIELLTTHS